jgi:Mg-chelatase subunit ChlD
MTVKVNNGLTLTCFAEASSVSARECRDMLLLARITAGAAAENAARAPVVISAVIDKSGSMAGGKLELVKKSLSFVISQLNPCDKLGVVSFGSNVSEDFPMTYMTAAAKASARSAVERIRTDGCTNLSGGLFMGMRQAAGEIVGNWEEGESTPPPRRGLWGTISSWAKGLSRNCESIGMKQSTSTIDAATSVWLFTDGQANQGISDPTKLCAAFEQELKGHPSTTVYTFGFGNDHSAKLLQDIARTGSGVYYYVENEKCIAEAFADCLGGIVSVVAQNVMLTLSVPEKFVTIKKIHTVYKTSLTDGGQVITIPDICAEEEKDILIEVTVNALEATEESWQCASFLVTYTDSASHQQCSSTSDLFIERLEKSGECVVPAPIDEQRNRLNCVEALKQATELANKGDVQEARNVVLDWKKKAEVSATKNSAVVMGLMECMDASVAKLSSERAYKDCGEQILCSYATGHEAQRSNIQTAAFYKSSAKSAMKKKLFS